MGRPPRPRRLLQLSPCTSPRAATPATMRALVLLCCIAAAITVSAALNCRSVRCAENFECVLVDYEASCVLKQTRKMCETLTNIKEEIAGFTDDKYIQQCLSNSDCERTQVCCDVFDTKLNRKNLKISRCVNRPSYMPVVLNGR